MKKLYNFIGALLLMVSCSMICISHIANKFFQEDIGAIVMGEVNLEKQIGMLFDEAMVFVTEDNKEQFNNLKEDIIDNQEIKQIIGGSTQAMLNDIVSDQTSNQDMQSVLKEMVHSYDKDIQMIVGSAASKEEITQYIDEVITTLPVQMVYDDVVDTFKQEMPASYKKILNIVNTISKEGVMTMFMVLSIIISVVLILMNRKQKRWLFPIGMGTLGSGILLLVAGQIVPMIYQGLLNHLDRVIANLSKIDFQIITYYGIVFTIFGSSCIVLYKVCSKTRNI